MVSVKVILLVCTKVRSVVYTKEVFNLIICIVICFYGIFLSLVAI